MSKLCFGCMQQKENTPVCEHCGFDETKENQPHQLPIGTLLQGQYLVGRVLGQGGFGITYIGWDQHLSVPVAIKEYFPGGVVQRHTKLSTKLSCVNGERPEVFYKHRDRFLKEARTLAQLTQIPEIVQIKSFFAENDTAYIIMEYVQGITLKARMQMLGHAMTEEDALAIMEPVLQALQKVHDQGLIHRDISPDNIMLPDEGGVKIIDFGTVRYLDDSGKSKSTETVLKPGFAPMEQYNSRGNLGTWTDVYAICATFHYLLTGKVPEESIARLDGDGRLPLLRSKQGLSSDLIRILEKGMAVRIPERIQSVGELYQLLYGLQKLPATEEPLSEQKSAKKAPAAKKSRKLIGIFALLVLLVLGFLLKQAPTTEPVPTQPTAEETLAAEPEQIEPSQNPPIGRNEIEIRYNEAVSLAQDGSTVQAAIAFGKLGNYRDAREKSFSLWNMVAPREVLSAQGRHTVGLRTDGRVLAAGNNDYGQCNVSDWTGIIAISSSYSHTVGLKADGTVVATGSNAYGQCDVSGWTDIVAIYANQVTQLDPSGDEPQYTYGFTLGLRADGTMVAAGYSDTGHCDVSGWTDVTQFAFGTCRWDNIFGAITVAVRADGTVLAAGTGTDSWCDVSGWEDIVSVCATGAHVVGLKADGTVLSVGNPQEAWGLYPSRYAVSDWQNIVQVYAHAIYTIGLKSDGTLVTAGNNSLYNNLNVSRWDSVIDVTAETHTVGLHSDGTVVAAGANDYSQCNVSGWNNIAAIYSSTAHTVGIRRDGTAVAAGDNQYGQCDVSGWQDLIIPG